MATLTDRTVTIINKLIKSGGIFLIASFFYSPLFGQPKKIAKPWQLPYATIESIEISGNQKTTDGEVRRLSELKVGEEVTPSSIERSKSALLSASIFEIAEVTAHRGSNDHLVHIKIHVKEKISWFIVPNLSYSSTGFGGGLAYGESNFLGLTKKVLFAGYFSSLTRTAIAGYRDPSMLGSNVILSVDGIYRWDTMKEYRKGDETRRVRMVEYGATVMPGIQWSPRFSTSLGVFVRRVEQKSLRENSSARTLDLDSLKDGKDISAVAQFLYQDFTNIDGLYSGSEVGLEAQISDNRFYSDFEYFRQILRLKYGLVFWDNRINYINNASGQFGRTLPYYRELMVGGDNLRGYKSREFRGDTRYTVNQEVLVPLYSFKRVITRAAFFWDSTVIYFKDQKFSRDAWRNGVGIGGRLYFKGVAIPLIGYDFGYGIEQKSFENYVNVGVSF